MCSVGTYFIVWPVEKNLTEHNFRGFHANMRCGCRFQVTHGCPCANKFAVNLKFGVNQY